LDNGKVHRKNFSEYIQTKDLKWHDDRGCKSPGIYPQNWGNGLVRPKQLAFLQKRKYAAWAGVASGNNESAGKKKDQNVDKAIRP